MSDDIGPRREIQERRDIVQGCLIADAVASVGRVYAPWIPHAIDRLHVGPESREPVIPAVMLIADYRVAMRIFDVIPIIPWRRRRDGEDRIRSRRLNRPARR